MKRYIPNAITLINLFCGLIAIIFVSEHEFLWAGFFVSLGIFFDFFDGFFARLFNVKSDLGLQLDSLADVVTSGVVPGYVMFHLLLKSCCVSGSSLFAYSLLPYVGFAITLASAYRLANFNVDTRQTSGFIGLPTPANALFIVSLPIILADYETAQWLKSLLENTWFLIGITALSAYMLNAEIPLFALKFKDFSLKNNKIKFIFLALCLIFLLLFKVVAVPLIIILYVFISFLQSKKIIS